MTSKTDLIRQLGELGVERGGVLLVHASFRAVRPVEGGPAGLIAALRDAIGSEGTLAMPSMTGSRGGPYDPATTPTRHMGIVAETFWRMPGVVRSDHPTSAFAAVGRRAVEITRPQPLAPVHGPDSPVGWIHDLDGQILLLGVRHDVNTTVHLAESLANVPYSTRKWTLVREGGQVRRRFFREIDHCTRGFAAVEAWLGQRQQVGPVGSATALLVRSRDVVSVTLPRLREEPTVLLCRRGSGCEECDRAWSSVRDA